MQTISYTTNATDNDENILANSATWSFAIKFHQTLLLHSKDTEGCDGLCTQNVYTSSKTESILRPSRVDVEYRRIQHILQSQVEAVQSNSGFKKNTKKSLGV